MLSYYQYIGKVNVNKPLLRITTLMLVEVHTQLSWLWTICFRCNFMQWRSKWWFIIKLIWHFLPSTRALFAPNESEELRKEIKRTLVRKNPLTFIFAALRVSGSMLWYNLLLYVCACVRFLLIGMLLMVTNKPF